VVAILEGDAPKVITNSEGSTRTPSVVSFPGGDEVCVGEVARRQGAVNPSTTIFSVKRLMGRTPQDIEAFGFHTPYELESTEDSQLVININDRLYTPSQVSSVILKKLKQAAEDYLGEPVGKAIITVPAYFDDLQRQATRVAGELAGLEILRLVNEPTAAAMAYGLGKERTERVAVYDFGGGTFDLTILEINDGTFEVLTSQGDTQLGGDDLDSIMVQYLLDHFRETSGIDFEPDDMAHRRLTDAAEKAKCELSLARQAIVHLPFLAQVDGNPVHLDVTVHREDFEDLIEPMLQRSLDCCRAALSDCDLKPTDIDKIIMVGGTTRIPLVQDLVEEFFGIQPFKGINPDEIVALGAATQAGVLAGKLKEVVLLDVTPHTLGVEVAENRTTRVIEKNTTIPVNVSRLFTTTEDGQEMVTIHVIQGESEKASENRSLGKFTLTQLDPGKAGSARVQVTFHVNADGMVEVVAEDMATHKQERMQLVLGENDTLQAARERAQGAAAARRRRRGRRGRGEAPEPEVLTGLEPVARADQTGARKLRQRDSSTASRAVNPKLKPTAQSGNKKPAAAKKGNDAPASMEAPSGHPTPSQTMPSQPPQRRPAAAPVAASHAENAPAPDPSSVVTGPNLSPLANQALALIGEKASSASAYEIYLKAYSELNDYARQHPDDFDIAAGAVRMLLTLGECEGARQLLSALSSGSSNPARYSGLHDEFAERFPVDAKSTQPIESPGASKQGVDTAIRQMEQQVTETTGTPEQIESLAQLYRRRLAHEDDPAIQYKLVKLLLRLERVDEAINMLQRLAQQETYRAGSLKILGLCFWQKGLHYLAWQKFQQLPPNDEIKDILYRLASDMEDTDQLLNAKVVFQHLVNADPNYKDGANRLKKIEQFIRMEAGNREASLTPSIFLTLKDSRFVILEEVNRGSMGIVYRARDKVLEEIVALKILNDYMTTDPSAVERFKREARAAKRLSHPNIVRIHDMFEYGQKKLLSMEFIEGVDLKSVLADRKTLPVYEIVGIARPVCEALAYAHQQSIVHRDIKPANIMITNTNQVKVTDFGIAKVLLAGADNTRSGSQIIGTPLYMSPEQILGGDVDARTDVYSFGVMLYEMAAGRPPFLEGNIEYHHLHTEPPPLDETVPVSLQKIIMKSMAKKPEDRFQSIGQLGEALARLGAI
jgi:molecular chaperone DnaK